VTAAAKSGQFTADKTRKGQFLRERRNLTGGSCGEKEFVSTKSSECALIFAIVGARGH